MNSDGQRQGAPPRLVESRLPVPLADLFGHRGLAISVQRWSQDEPLRETWMSPSGAILLTFSTKGRHWHLDVLAVRSDDRQIDGSFRIDPDIARALHKLVEELANLLDAFEEPWPSST